MGKKVTHNPDQKKAPESPGKTTASQPTITKESQESPGKTINPAVGGLSGAFRGFLLTVRLRRRGQNLTCRVYNKKRGHTATVSRRFFGYPGALKRKPLKAPESLPPPTRPIVPGQP